MAGGRRRGAVLAGAAALAETRRWGKSEGKAPVASLPPRAAPSPPPGLWSRSQFPPKFHPGRHVISTKPASSPPRKAPPQPGRPSQASAGAGAGACLPLLSSRPGSAPARRRAAGEPRAPRGCRQLPGCPWLGFPPRLRGKARQAAKQAFVRRSAATTTLHLSGAPPMRFGRLLPAARTRRSASAASAGCLRARRRRALCEGAPLRRGRSRVMKTMKGSTTEREEQSCGPEEQKETNTESR
uniref:uncharacterized protein LOC114593419 n=1 Tax=Podarcis muralis TaxID=64176 RepID=UPI00109F1044|nr:uncharacterized protein LOC114593419 [Podarcis muralis]